MKDILVLLNSIDKIKSFVNVVSKFPEDMDIVHGRYVIDAKSIMGVLSLDTSKLVTLRIHSDDNEVVENIVESIKALDITVE